MMPMHGMMDGWWPMHPLGWVLTMLLWGLVILGVVAAVRWLFLRGTRPEAGPPEPPLEILKRRYARGELSREEFERMKKRLQ